MTVAVRRALVALIAAGAVVAQPAAGLASCIAPPPLEEAIAAQDLLFVGVVTGTTNDQRWATVQVIEIWKGPDLPEIVNVKGGPEPGTATSVDRTFELGRRYLFFPFEGGGVLEDNACSPTQLYTPELDPFRPAGARPPLGASAEPGPTEGEIDDAGSSGGPVDPVIVSAIAGLGVLTVIGIVVAVTLVRRRRTGA